MPTMLYELDNERKEKYSLLVSGTIDEFDNTKFWVINGCWDGYYVGGACFIDHDRRFIGNLKPYVFKGEIPKEYEWLFERNDYDAYFCWFRDLLDIGEIH
ncbi:MAG: hypothetical protein KBT03_13095 [Bacteroidales bacterium]|nr:hypothetical protein [Candidatus Scybalousia scybalohippi]